MHIGFVSAILGDLTLEEVLAFASDEGFGSVEVMCWPPGKADRRYAGVTHLDVSNFNNESAGKVRDLVRKQGVQISGLGYYPNPLDPDLNHRRTVVEHLKAVVHAAPMIGINTVNTFIGRDSLRNIPQNLNAVNDVWPDIVHAAERADVCIGIENCPMIFSNDEWPGGKNLAISPSVWTELFRRFPGGRIGLNFDPSHLVWQFIDIARAVREFGSHIVHVHAKDEKIDREQLYQVGAQGLGWHVPKLPGLGDVPWGEFFSALTDTGYQGAISIEVEDRAYEGSLNDRKRALRQSKRFLEQFVG